MQKLNKIEPLTFQFADQKFYSAKLIDCSLNQFISHSFFDYYRILKMKWKITPATPTFEWQYWGYGVSVIDLDDNAVEAQPTSPPWSLNSSRRVFKPWRGHSRYFSPKPQLKTQGAQSDHFPVNNRQWWWNANQTGIQWLGVKVCLYSPDKNWSYPFIQQKTIWVAWKQSI